MGTDSLSFASFPQTRAQAVHSSLTRIWCPAADSRPNLRSSINALHSDFQPKAIRDNTRARITRHDPVLRATRCGPACSFSAFDRPFSYGRPPTRRASAPGGLPVRALPRPRRYRALHGIVWVMFISEPPLSRGRGRPDGSRSLP